MRDRQPTRPGRVKITPESGAAYYAVMEMADEPTEVGTPPTKANLLKDTTAALLGGDDSMVPDEALVAIFNKILNLTASDVGAPRIETGSFTGNGNNTGVLNFSGKPLVVFITNKTHPSYDGPFGYAGIFVLTGLTEGKWYNNVGYLYFSNGNASDADYNNRKVYVSGNQLQWAASSNEYAFDNSSYVYHYIAFLEG